MNHITRSILKHSKTIKLHRNLNIGFVGAPFNLGQPKAGVEEGPQAIRLTGVIDRLKTLGHDVKDYGDVNPNNKKGSVGPDGELHFNEIMSYNHKLANAVSSVVNDGRVCVTLGGDHSIGIGTIQGHAQAKKDKQVVALWVDAHADINTGKTSWSGNMHGMSAAFHLRELKDQINKINQGNWPVPCINGEHLVYIGLRDLDEKEQQTLNDLGILWFGTSHVDRLGINEVIKRCLTKLSPSSTRPLHVSLDIDSLDPIQAPSTGTAVPGGLTLREVMLIMESTLSTGHLSALDLVEVNPRLSTEANAQLTATAAKHLLLVGLANHRGT